MISASTAPGLQFLFFSFRFFSFLFFIFVVVVVVVVVVVADLLLSCPYLLGKHKYYFQFD